MGQQETPSLSKSYIVVVVQHSCLALSIYYYIEVGFSVPLTSEHISQSDFLSVRQKVSLLISLHSLFFVGLYCIRYNSVPRNRFSTCTRVLSSYCDGVGE